MHEVKGLQTGIPVDTPSNCLHCNTAIPLPSFFAVSLRSPFPLHTIPPKAKSPEPALRPPQNTKPKGEDHVKTNLHNLILQLRQEEIHNLKLLHGQTVQVDLLHALDLPGLDQPPQLRHGHPLLLLGLAAAAATSSSPASASSASAVAAAR